MRPPHDYSDARAGLISADCACPAGSSIRWTVAGCAAVRLAQSSVHSSSTAAPAADAAGLSTADRAVSAAMALWGCSGYGTATAASSARTGIRGIVAAKYQG